MITIEQVKKLEKILKRNGIIYKQGMNDCEIKKAEDFYDIIFPNDYKLLLKTFLPISAPFYDWNDFSEANILKIKHMLEWPIEGILFDIENSEFWMEDFGEMPSRLVDRIAKFKEYADCIPKLVPIYSHRYMISDEEPGYPVISVHQTDIIYYGANLYEYFLEEFGSAHNQDIEIKKEIPFWSKIIEL